MTTTVLTLDSKRWYDPNSSSYKTTGEMWAGYEDLYNYDVVRCAYRFILPAGYEEEYILSVILALTVNADNQGYGADTIIGPHDGTTAFNSIDLTPSGNFDLLLPKGIEDDYMGFGRDYTVTQGSTAVVNVDLTDAIKIAIEEGKIDSGGINIIWDNHPDWYGYDYLKDNNVAPTLTLTTGTPPEPSPFGLGDEVCLFRGPTGNDDLSTHAHDGTYQGGLTVAADTGENGVSAFDMDGVDDRIKAYTIDQDSNWTLAAWVKINSGNQKGSWIKNNSQEANDEISGFSIGIGSTDYETAGRKLLLLNSSKAWSVSSYTFANDGWHHIALTRSGNDMTAYVNGASVHTAYFVPNTDGDMISFGGFEHTSQQVGTFLRYAPNRMDDCCQFDRVLDKWDIQALASRRNYDHTWGLHGLTHRYCATLTDNITDSFGISHGSFQGGMGTEADVTHGGTKAYAFNDSNDYVSFASEHYSPGTKDFSFSCWFRSDTAGAGTQWIYSNRSGNNSIGVFTYSGKIRIHMSDSSLNIVQVDSATTISADTWYHIAFTWDGSANETRVFINGTYESSGTNGSIGSIDVSDGAAPVMGAYSGSGGSSTYRIYGAVEDLMIFRVELDDSVIAEIADNPPGWDGVIVESVVATITLDDVTMSADAVSVVSGDVGIVLDDVSMAASGASRVSSESTIVLDDVAMDSQGTQLSVARASSFITLDDVTMTAVADLVVHSTSTIILDDVSMSVDAELIVGAASTIALDDVSMVGSGDSSVASVASITLDDVSLATAGESILIAESTIVLDDVTLSSGSQTSVSATSTIVLDDIALSIDVPSNNRISVVLDDVTMDSSGANIVGADATIVLDDISATIVAAVSSLTGDDVLFPNDLFPGELFTTEIFV
ncbi:LamG domain-containing protein [Aporhodopirellula aestuarii]|uniref:LamG domain-containing protein n=1 Tax=Aporhodopirellula aestuarii TaxID=2950107 RepID=A0ABT0U250_9BACT|nr:LamG domain-containing protein [Aporhodopirellula aestuarii]MCM2370952.1 LamG domain-containing protein [Aporhodopirellula aestuarii]